ncbi:glycosyltransferase family 4 protein [Patescibacteria group bacterium]|nr:glycosyltransferase family 4 protein [Patescibacteria group bacterium]
MKIVLATGIYPPDIGGPATYVSFLAEEFLRDGIEVVVVTYGVSSKFQQPSPSRRKGYGWRARLRPSRVPSSKWEVVRVKKGFCPVMRWFRYAKALKKVGQDADIVYAFSSVSCGVPLKLARLKKPKKILRLGGDFGWERYTDWGGKKSLREWHEKSFLVSSFWFLVYRFVLNTFNHIIFSTRFQEEIYENHFTKLPYHSIIENALPEGRSEMHGMNAPIRLLFMGRFVAFKNLQTLIKALDKVDARMTMVGDGPIKKKLQSIASSKIIFVSPVSGEEKQKIFQSHDLMVIPSITEISPNVALEARSAGLPVLLTSETGLSSTLSEGMILKDMRGVDQIVAAIKDVRSNYTQYAQNAAHPLQKRGWDVVAQEHLLLINHME